MCFSARDLKPKKSAQEVELPTRLGVRPRYSEERGCGVRTRERAMAILPVGDMAREGRAWVRATEAVRRVECWWIGGGTYCVDES